MTYYNLCRQYAEEFLDNCGDPQELIQKLVSVVNSKSPYDEWDAPICEQDRKSLGLED